MNTYSNANTPAKITVNETKTKKELRVLQDNAALKSKLKEYVFAKKEFMKVHTASDYEFNAWIVKPADFDPSKKYPVMMTQYSGPNSQQVLDQYGFDWEQYLASNGIIVVCVDGRGTGARGEAFRKCTYLRMGELESRDQVEAAQALGKLPYIDKDRIAIWGWSFGGYNTLMALSTGNGTFKVGIAVAPPTDWKYYDSVYTERFMRTPQENFEGYAATSPLRRVKDLQGKLMEPPMIMFILCKQWNMPRLWFKRVSSSICMFIKIGIIAYTVVIPVTICIRRWLIIYSIICKTWRSI